jgi:adenylate cyclase
MEQNVGQGFQLVYQVAGTPVVRHFDQDRVVLGHSVVCDIAFDSPYLSRKHAEIIRDGDGWILQDMGSRHGVAVNGRLAARSSLAHGDRIVLAPDAAEPTALEFRLPVPADLSPPQAIVSDESGPTSVVASIDLRELSTSLGQSGRGRLAPIDLHTGDTVSRILMAPGSALFESKPQLPVLSLFKSVGEILLAHESLDEMLQLVVNLIAEHLPGRRSVACIYDQDSGEIQPRCFSREPPHQSDSPCARSVSRDYLPANLGSTTGESMSPLERPQPMLRQMQPMMISRSILKEAVRVERAMLVASVADDPRFHAALSIEQMGIRSAICVPLYHQGQITGVIYVDSQRDAGPLDSRDLEVLTVLGLMVAAGIAQISLRSDVARERTMRQRLARYNSPHVVEQIMKLAPRQEDEMQADEYDVSVLFADLTGFSAIAENWAAGEVVRVLNLVFERWTSNVFQRDGTLDKYIGDAVMAVFGAPLRQTDHAQRAVATALAMQRTLDELNRLRPEAPPLRLRAGINSGRVIAGDIGSPLHKAYTVIGDVVNIASRLETSVAQPGQVVIGQATFEQIAADYVCEPLGEMPLRGKRQAIRAYRVVGPSPLLDTSSPP